MDKNEKPKGATATPFTPDPSETPTVTGLPNHPPKPASKTLQKKKPLIILIVVVAVLFLGAAAFGIYWWVNRDFRISPNMVEFESDGGAMRVRVEGPSNWRILDSSKNGYTCRRMAITSNVRLVKTLATNVVTLSALVTIVNGAVL